MTKAQLARANLPARVWIQWRPGPTRPWAVVSGLGKLAGCDTVGACQRWLARYGYEVAPGQYVTWTGTGRFRAEYPGVFEMPVYVKATPVPVEQP